MSGVNARADETQEQICLFEWAEYSRGRWPELALMYHVPNEGKRSQGAGGRLKAAGMKAGVPDICLPVRRADYGGLYIELKVNGAKPRREQKQWLEALAQQGYITSCCDGWEKASRVISRYLQLPKPDNQEGAQWDAD